MAKDHLGVNLMQVDSPLDLSQVELRKADNSGPADPIKPYAEEIQRRIAAALDAYVEAHDALQNQEEAVSIPKSPIYWDSWGPHDPPEDSALVNVPTPDQFTHPDQWKPEAVGPTLGDSLMAGLNLQESDRVRRAMIGIPPMPPFVLDAVTSGRERLGE